MSYKSHYLFIALGLPRQKCLKWDDWSPLLLPRSSPLGWLLTPANSWKCPLPKSPLCSYWPTHVHMLCIFPVLSAFLEKIPKVELLGPRASICQILITTAGLLYKVESICRSLHTMWESFILHPYQYQLLLFLKVLASLRYKISF